MKRLLVVIPAVLLAMPAFAQTAPEDAYRDLWCGLAFGSAASNLPYTPEELAAARAAGAQANEQQQQLIQYQAQMDQFIEGGNALVERATEAYIAAGFTQESFATVRTELEPKVTEQVAGSSGSAEFSYEECLALLPAAQGGAMGATPSTDATTTTTTAPASESATTTTTTTAPAAGSATTTTTTTTPASPATTTTTTAQ
jgi:hypothetical protein